MTIGSYSISDSSLTAAKNVSYLLNEKVQNDNWIILLNVRFIPDGAGRQLMISPLSLQIALSLCQVLNMSHSL